MRRRIAVQPRNVAYADFRFCIWKTHGAHLSFENTGFLLALHATGSQTADQVLFYSIFPGIFCIIHYVIVLPVFIKKVVFPLSHSLLSFKNDRMLLLDSFRFYFLFPANSLFFPTFFCTLFHRGKSAPIHIIFMITYEYSELFTLSTHFSTLVFS